MKNYIFLLGGLDLEMITIRDILSDRKLCFYDRSLSWDNANLSKYNDVIVKHSEDYIVGIELREDIPTPANYISIDHHNANSTRPSSIEQVASLLRIKLNRYQKIVAVNDSEYIDGMKKIGASADEIDNIRLLDRKCQNVTEEEEIEAEAIIDSIDRNQRIIVVKTKLKHFSPITDRLYPFENLIISNEKEVVYYGNISKMITSGESSPEITANEVYYGGRQDAGYFGVLLNNNAPVKDQEIIEWMIKFLNK